MQQNQINNEEISGKMSTNTNYEDILSDSSSISMESCSAYPQIWAKEGQYLTKSKYFLYNYCFLLEIE